MFAMKMFLLYYGVTYVDKGLILTAGKDVGRIVPTPIWGTLIGVGDKWVLVDTGMNPIHISDPDATHRGTSLFGKIRTVLNIEDLAVNRVKSCGIDPAQVTYVINTHFHFDHCGGNLFFPNAEFVVQKDHYEWALQSEQCPKRDFNIPGLRWRLVDGDQDFLPGVKLIATPGHVPGHQSVIIHLPETGPVIITGDAIFLKETMEKDAPVTAFDPILYRLSVKKIVEMERQLSARILVAHEQKEWERWKHAPEYYV